MKAPAALRQICEQYVARHSACDLEGVMALFGEGAVVEDPVGAPAFVGLEAIRGFFRDTHRRNGRLRMEAVGPVICSGDEAVMHVRAAIEASGSGSPVDVIYHLRLGEDRRLQSMRAFFDMDA